MDQHDASVDNTRFWMANANNFVDQPSGVADQCNGLVDQHNVSVYQCPFFSDHIVSCIHTIALSINTIVCFVDQRPDFVDQTHGLVN